MNEEKPSGSLCCFTRTTKVSPEKADPIIFSQPVDFSTPPRAGFKRAPEPPEDKGPSIIYENGHTKKDIPTGFHLSDLSGNVCS